MPNTSAAPTLHGALENDSLRRAVAVDACAEADAAVRARSGLGGAAARLALDLIDRLRPGFLERHVYMMLPALAQSVESFWATGVEQGDPLGHLHRHRFEVAHGLLTVSDAYVDAASDAQAVAVYRRIRHAAPRRIADEMPRIARFLERHSPRLR